MKTIVAEKQKKLYIGSIVDISSLLNVYPNKITNWIKSGDRTVEYDGYIIFLDVKVFKSKRLKQR